MERKTRAQNIVNAKRGGIIMDWHKKFQELSTKFQELQEKVARQGRRIEALTKESKKKQ